MNYTTLVAAKTTVGSIRNWCNRTDIPVDDILVEAESWIYERLRAREMTVETAITVSLGADSTGVPADFLDPIQLIPFGDATELPYVQESALAQVRDALGVVLTGAPERWSVVGTALKTNMRVPADFGAQLTYYARPAALSGTNLTNFLTVRYPTLLRNACMAFAFQHMKDDARTKLHFEIAMAAIKEANDTDANRRRKQRTGRGGGSLSFSTLTGELEVEGSIRNWVKNVDAPAEIILAEAQAYIYERLRVREMLTSAAFQFDTGAASETLPADFLDPMQLLPYGASKELPYVEPEALAVSTDALGVVQSGTPSRWSVVGSEALIDVEADSNFAGSLLYYARPAPLATGNETNFLTTRFPSLLRAASMAFAYQALQDSERAQENFVLAEKTIKEANETDALWRRNQRTSRILTTFSFDLLTADMEVSGSIRNMMGKNELAAEVILLEAEALIFQRLRVREMLAVDDDFTFAEDTSETALPADFLDPIEFRPYAWGYPLPFVHETNLEGYRDEAGDLPSGTPSRWSILGTTASVDVSCSEAFIGVLSYYAKPTALSGANPTNFLTTRYPTLLRYACMVKGFEHIRQFDEAQRHMVYLENHMHEANATNEMFRRSQYVLT